MLIYKIFYIFVIKRGLNMDWRKKNIRENSNPKKVKKRSHGDFFEKISSSQGILKAIKENRICDMLRFMFSLYFGSPFKITG